MYMEGALPEEVVQGEILTRLPARSLARFESVNKTWRSLITSPDLTVLCKRRGRGGVVEPEWSIEKLAARLADLEEKCKELLVPPWKSFSVEEDGEGEGEGEGVIQPDESLIVSALGPTPDFGFYCLAAYVKKNRLKDIYFDYRYPYRSPCYYLLMSGRLALFNPATRGYKLTNPFPPEIRRPLFSRVVPLNMFCTVHLGFGNLSSLFHHKVVVVVRYGGRRASFESLVYSFVEEKWSNTLPPTAAAEGSSITKIFDTKQSLLKGNWHWTALLNNTNTNSYGILSFDLGSNEYKLMGGPPAHVDCRNHDPDYLHVDPDEEAEVCVMRERLTVIHMARLMELYRFRIYVAKVDVFMMMEYGVEESWVKLYTLEPEPCGLHTVINFIGVDYRSNANSFQGFYFKGLYESIYRLDKNGYNSYKEVLPPNYPKHSCYNFYAPTLRHL